MNYIDKAFELALDLDKLDDLQRYKVVYRKSNKYYYEYSNNKITLLFDDYIIIDLEI